MTNTNTNTTSYLNKEVLAQKVYEYLSDNNVLFEDIQGCCGVELYNIDLHHELFNMELCYIYTTDAIKDLEEYGTFQAIGEVQLYEEENFGDLLTDFSSPCDIANMLVYILGEEVVGLVQDELWEWYNELEGETQEDEQQVQTLFKEFCKNKA